MRFRLVEDVERLNEGYELLWKQFEQAADIKCKEYDLHHIYNDNSSTNNGDINFALLPSTIHKHMPKNMYRPDSIDVYHHLKDRYPDQFKTITVSFDVFTPTDVKAITDKQKKINTQRRNSRRNKYKKPSTADIINKIDKEGATV